MADQTEGPSPSRRRMLQAALVLPAAAAAAAVGGASPAHAAYNGNIKRSRVITRARYWYDRNVDYNGSSYTRDWEGDHTYRQDCSGFVSQCWHTAGSYSTRSLPEISRQKPWDNLKPGDILNKAAAYPNGHVMLFEKWSGEGPGLIRAYELTTAVDGMRCKTYAVSDLRARGYVPRQYHRIVAG
ncbi:hypothetical protein LO763_19360 [Glycomyces sp. A-F 0318]|uniref:hypothetical protein n=1 Tax=Glycomyces amatae TaxID=2881355 RepID=UPI001E3DDAF6|nr:hypothetical protein [Glycomyces amatae]MCD0445770.1 hypothetical protein [Glycomyces amatae]